MVVYDDMGLLLKLEVVYDDMGLLLKLEVVLSSIGIRGTGNYSCCETLIACDVFVFLLVCKIQILYITFRGLFL